MDADDRIEVRLGIWPKVKVVADALMPVAIVILGVAVWTLAGSQSDTADLALQIERSAECRYDRNAEVSSENDWVDYWTYVGFKAAATDDQAGVLMAIRNGDVHAERLRELIGDRDSIAEQCSASLNGYEAPSSEDP